MAAFPSTSVTILLLLFVLSAPKASYKETSIKSAREKCHRESAACSGVKQVFAANCISRCVSEKCYNEVYGTSPLEFGEVDTARERSFVECAFQERRGRKEW